MKLSKIVTKIKAKNRHKKIVKATSGRKFVNSNHQDNFDVQEYHNPLLGIKRE